MNKQDEANFICDAINEFRYTNDNWKNASVIKTYYEQLNDLNYMYDEFTYDIVSYDEEIDDFYVNDEYLDDDEY